MSTRLIEKTIELVRTAGLWTTMSKIGRYLITPFVEQRLKRQIFKHESVEARFSEIYRLNAWGSAESVSGNGSTLASTEGVRKSLPNIFEAFGIRSVFDAPCGDFNWMRYVLQAYPVDYIGADIVADLVEKLNASFATDRLQFLHLDLTNAKFPQTDLMICRDCLFHLSYEDTRLILNNFVDADIPYLLTSTHKTRAMFENKNIKTGGFRLINLFAQPYNFPSTVLARFDDVKVGEKETEMGLWRRDQIIDALKTFET